jgi:hypothetical protein
MSRGGECDGRAGWLKSIGVVGTLQPPGACELVLSDGADASVTAEYAFIRFGRPEWGPDLARITQESAPGARL